MRSTIFIILSVMLFACKDDMVDPQPNITPYFPPTNNANWAIVNTDSLNWDNTKLTALYQLLETNKTRAFIVLKNGKIAIEKYWDKEIIGQSNFNRNSEWYWASAGKTLTSFVVGKAAEDGYLNLDDKISKYLGNGWTSLTAQQEDRITIKHQLSMTTGLNDAGLNSDKTSKEYLIFKANAGERWAYHNAPYTLLDTVVESATNQTFEYYFNTTLKNKIGMDGKWHWLGDNHVYFSTALSMARFGSLILNNGKWQNNRLINADYYNAMVNTSQNLNPAYGYLWWLNGKSNYMLPGSQIVFPGKISSHAPTDMFAALGKNGQYLCVVPSQNIVMVRLGENPDNALVPKQFLNDIWERFKDVTP